MGWRADVYVPNSHTPIAFEVQLCAQTLLRTLERQEKFAKDGIKGCWLFERPVHKLNEERPDLPLFYVESNDDDELIVNLGDRRKIKLEEFLQNFISGNIQFRQIAKTNPIQNISLVFYEMDCWKCNHTNHLYFVNSDFHSSCNAKIKPEEALWESNNLEYMPEIIAAAKKILESENLYLGEIKPRFSKTIGEKYVSFGCYNCDSIFGDYYVMEAKIDVMYDLKRKKYKREIQLNEDIIIPNLPHWCYPHDGRFC